MAKMTLGGLKKLRETLLKDKAKTDSGDTITRILVGMGTCGIAAGANDTMKELEEQISKMGLKDIELKPTGCMGACYVEPTVEVSVPGMPNILYGKVTPEIARKILENHVVQKRLINDVIVDKPAIDIIR